MGKQWSSSMKEMIPRIVGNVNWRWVANGESPSRQAIPSEPLPLTRPSAGRTVAFGETFGDRSAVRRLCLAFVFAPKA